MTTNSPPRAWQVLLAFGIIYFVWGSTFLAIRIGVREVPPFLLAAIRFVVAGTVLYGWTRARGTPSPTLREWGAASLIAIPVFVLDFGLVFWAEQRVPSGITAVMMATIPAFMALSEITILKTQRLTLRLAFALLVGIAGVTVLVARGMSFGGTAVDPAGACALVVAAISWSIAAALNRKVPLPVVKSMSSAAQMLAGGVWLTLTAALLGEFRGFDARTVSIRAWLALAYLTVAGSVFAYTAYVWLLHHESPTRVGTYAYVNPVIAVVLGHFFAGEAVGPRTAIGTLFVLVITTGKRVTVSPPAEIRQELVES